MRLFSILTAIVVAAVLALLVLERERLFAFAGREPVAEATETDVVDAESGAETASATTEDESDTSSAVKVVALRSEASLVDSAVIVRGRTEAAREVDVRAEISGLVISDPLRKGAQVTDGQELCRLDIGTRDVALAEAEGRLAEARAREIDAEVNLRAASRLSEGGFASETRLTAAQAAAESARAGVQTGEAAVASANKTLERLVISAPFDGLLETDTAELGTLLQPGSVCATVIQLDPIKLVGFIPEVAVDRVTLGAPAGARLATGQQVQGNVTFLSRSADEATRTFRVEIEVANSDLAIRDGQTAEIFIGSDGEEAHLLPQSSLTLNDEGVMGVRIVESDVAAFRPVEIVRDTTEGIWVTGLGTQADVIVVGQEYVREGVPVDATLQEVMQ